MKFNVLFASLLLALSTQAFAEDAAKTADPAAAITAAEAAHKAAQAVGFEWRDTAKMIKSAKEAAKAGDAEKAIKLANAAKLQGDMGVKQAETAKNAEPRF
ncbi:MAG TPA: SoxXA-binding protein [Thiothrix sp.]|nr:SoxXA-binding protein [Thiothrix sp.]